MSLDDDLTVLAAEAAKIREFVIAVRVKARLDEFYNGTTDKARTKLIIEIQSRLKDKNNRLRVLQAITGLPLESQNQLTAHYTGVLIEEFIDDKNREAISLIERYIESKPNSNAWNLFPWEHPTPQVSDMQ